MNGAVVAAAGALVGVAGVAGLMSMSTGGGGAAWSCMPDAGNASNMTKSAPAQITTGAPTRTHRRKRRVVLSSRCGLVRMIYCSDQSARSGVT